MCLLLASLAIGPLYSVKNTNGYETEMSLSQITDQTPFGKVRHNLIIESWFGVCKEHYASNVYQKAPFC